MFPLICPTCQTPLTFIAVLTDPQPIFQILAHIGEPTSPLLMNPASGPPQTEPAIAPGGGQPDKAAQESIPDDLDQSSEFDPTESEPVHDDDIDQSRAPALDPPPARPQARPENPRTPLPQRKPHHTCRSSPVSPAPSTFPQLPQPLVGPLECLSPGASGWVHYPGSGPPRNHGTGRDARTKSFLLFANNQHRRHVHRHSGRLLEDLGLVLLDYPDEPALLEKRGANRPHH